MASAKDIRVAPCRAADAKALVKSIHYSGKIVRNSQLHLGVWLDGRLEGAMQFGPPMDKKKIIGLVEGTRWNGFLELNRMAFSDRLPRNSESRALGVACRMIRKTYPHIEWIISFADGTQCGDGTIYRAAGFLLTDIKKSKDLFRLPDGTTIHKVTLSSSPTAPRPELGGRSFYDVTGGKHSPGGYLRATGGVVIPGFQLRYIKPLNDTVRDRLTCKVLPYSAIEKAGASMYRGKRRKEASEA